MKARCSFPLSTAESKRSMRQRANCSGPRWRFPSMNPARPSLLDHDGAAGRQGQGVHRERRRRVPAVPRICFGIRRQQRQGTVALLHRPRRSFERIREQSHGSRGQDLDRRMVEVWSAADRSGTAWPTIRTRTCSMSEPAMACPGRRTSGRERTRRTWTTSMSRPSSPSMPTPAS